jgi:hypothetical protein
MTTFFGFKAFISALEASFIHGGINGAIDTDPSSFFGGTTSSTT